jgi:rubrerythrin
MGTADNLRSAFAGESQANQTYTAYAKKADIEGYPQIARLFRAAAAAEQVHAQAHLRVLDQVKGTGENLQSAIAGEASEFTAMYPGFVSEAEAEGNDDAVMSFKNALAVEKIHHRLYSEALKSLDAGSDLSPSPIFVCGVCGNTVPGEAPEKCPICGAPRKRFSEIA